MTNEVEKLVTPHEAVIADQWTELRHHTAARIALGRAGAALPTRASLDFGLAHAQARDAVHTPLDVAALRSELEAKGWPAIEVRSRAPDRAAYLARPDWGRRLDDESALVLQKIEGKGFDLVIVVADGLSSLATQRQTAPLLAALKPFLESRLIAPLVIATQGRVALSDEIGALLHARIALGLIGERPGLSAADSLGAYLTYAPRLGRSDAERNCISNIRPGGLSFDDAAAQIAALIETASTAQLSGVRLQFDPTRALPPAL